MEGRASIPARLSGQHAAGLGVRRRIVTVFIAAVKMLVEVHARDARRQRPAAQSAGDNDGHLLASTPAVPLTPSKRWIIQHRTGPAKALRKPPHGAAPIPPLDCGGTMKFRSTPSSSTPAGLRPRQLQP